MSDLLKTPKGRFPHNAPNLFYQGGDNETSFGDESGGETEPLLRSPVGNNAIRTSMEGSKDAIEIVLEEPFEKKKGITRERVFVVLTILLTELCERLTYYSVVANMVLFCTSVLDMSSDDASVVTLIFAGMICGADMNRVMRKAVFGVSDQF